MLKGRFSLRSKLSTYVTLGTISLVAVFYGQNCSQTKFTDGNVDSSSQAAGFDVAEDDLFYKMQNATATASELDYSKQKYSDYISDLISNINTSAVKSNPGSSNNQIKIEEVMTQITDDLRKVVDDLKTMIFTKKLATNSKDVLKKYAELVDLLARARDINNYLILKSDIGSVRIDVAKLRSDFTALQASLQEVRTVIIPALKNELTDKMKAMETTLRADADLRDAALRKALTDQEKNLLAQIAAQGAALRGELSAAQQSILDQMKAGNKQIMDDLNSKYKALQDQMSAQDQAQRDALNQKYIQLSGKISESEARLRDELNSRYNAAMSQMSANDKALRDKLNSDYAALTSNLNQTKTDLVNKIIEGDQAVRSEFDKKLATLKDTLVAEMATTNKAVNDRINGVEALAKSNLTQIKEIQDVIVNINQRIRDTSDSLKALSAKVSSDIASINSQFEAIRTAGNANYAEMVSNWNCSEDMIDKQGFEFYGSTAFKGIGLPVSQACITSKEKVLYSICVERYPTFCGACAGYADPATCPAWQGMSGKDRLEILMNIRQEVAIHYLNEQSRLQSEAIYGGNSCNVKCLTQVSDPAVQNVVGNLYAPPSGTATSCKADEWKNCGLYGVVYSLAANDVNLANKMVEVNTNLAVEIAKLRKDFETEKTSVAKRFSASADEMNLIKSQMDQKIANLKATTEQRFMSVAQAMAGVASGSGGQIATDLANRSAFLASLAQESANKQSLFLESVGIAMGGKTSEFAKASLGGLDDETITVLANGMAVSSFDILTQIFSTLNPNQNNRPFYDVDLQNRVAGQCAGFVKYTPFTNILGRDSHELLALYYLKSLLSGERSATANNNRIYFNMNGIIKSSMLPQKLVAAAYDYRVDPSKAVPAACLTAVEAWAKDIVQNNAQFDSYRTQLSQNTSLQRMVSLLFDDANRIVKNLGSIEALIISTPGADNTTMSASLSEVANRLLAASITRRMYNLTSTEVEGLIAVQKELAAKGGFNDSFNNYLLTYRDQMSQFKAGQIDLQNQLKDQMAQVLKVQGTQAAQAAQISQLRDAMGYVYALAQTDPLASQAIKDKLSAAATVDAGINDLINKINAKPPVGAPEVPFKPEITAIRHVTSGNTSCFGQAPVAGQLPSGSAFVGSWGLGGQAAPWFSGENCAINFRTTTSYKDAVLYRIWGSAHKISYRSTIGGSPIVVDFRQPEQASPLRKITAGGFAEGVFDAQVPGLLDPAVNRGYAYNDGIVEMTPIYVSKAGAETKGAPQVYTMTLYSPLVLDFVNVGTPKLINPAKSNVQFDLTDSGVKDTVGWISGNQGGLLALDLNGNGKIDSGAELFGEFTRVKKSGSWAKNGYEALAQYDDNHDGVIDTKDSVYNKLLVWFDKNANGLCEQGELVQLSDAKVTSIALNYRDVPKERQNVDENKIKLTAKFFGPEQCGHDGCNSYDVYFGTSWKRKFNYLTGR